MTALAVERQIVTAQTLIDQALRYVEEDGDTLTAGARRALATWSDLPIFELAVTGLVHELGQRQALSRSLVGQAERAVPQARSYVHLRPSDVFDMWWGPKRLRDFTAEDCERYEKTARGQVHTWHIRQAAFVKARTLLGKHGVATIGELPAAALAALRPTFTKAWA